MIELQRYEDALTILLVEDNPAHAELIMRGLVDVAVPNRIFHLSDGKIALDFLFRRGIYSDSRLSPTPNLVLLDLRLPKVDGIEVLSEVKSSSKLNQIPVVILTTSAADQDLVRAYDQHANSYLIKPVVFSKFSKLMIDLGVYWLAHNKMPLTPLPKPI